MADSHNKLMGIGGHTAVSLEMWSPLQETTGTTANDETGSYDGTIVGMGSDPVTRTGPNGYLTSAFDFVPNGDDITYTDLGDVINGQAAWCIGMYADLDTYGQSLGGRLFQLQSSNLSARTPSNEKLYFTHEGNGFNSGVDIVDGSWNAILFQKEATTKSIFIDGTEYSESDSGSTGTASEDMVFGNSPGSSRALDGGLCNLFVFSRALTDDEWTESLNGPELVYSTGVSLTDAGAFDIGTWALPSPFASGSNGTQTQEVRIVNAAGTEIDTTVTTATGTFDLSSEAGNTVYLLVRASNSGGYDIGDFATRVSGYGSAEDGYFEVSSVTVASTGGPFRRIAGRGLLG